MLKRRRRKWWLDDATGAGPVEPADDVGALIWSKLSQIVSMFFEVLACGLFARLGPSRRICGFAGGSGASISDNEALRRKLKIARGPHAPGSQPDASRW